MRVLSYYFKLCIIEAASDLTDWGIGINISKSSKFCENGVFYIYIQVLFFHLRIEFFRHINLKHER